MRSYLLLNSSFLQKNGAKKSNYGPHMWTKKHTFEMHGMKPRVQLIPDCRDGYIKLKLLASPSRWTRALIAFSLFSSGKSGLHPLMDVTSTENKKFKRDMRYEPSNPNKSINIREHIKRKLFKDHSKIILTLSLKLIISAKKQGSKENI